MISNSTVAYAWVMTWVVILHSIGPLCTLYCALAGLLPSSLRLPRLFESLAFAETIFYFMTYLYQRYHLQRPALHPLPLPKDQRDKLVSNCQDTTPNHQRFIERWFLDKPLAAIKRENIKEFYRWAFLNTADDDPQHEEEISNYVYQLEMRLGMKFEPGRADDVKCMRLTLDEVNALHRSLIWYMCIYVVDILTHAYLRWHHFQFYRSSIARSLGALPPRPHALLTSYQSPVSDLSYWYHQHTSSKELPVLFLHGIGVGLYPYMQFLDELNAGRHKDEKIGILAIEILPVSSRIVAPVLRKEEMCRQIQAILDRHGFEKFVVASHSYGSVIATHILKTPDIARKISSVVLVDPVSILLHQPDVAYNFTVRRPKLASEWLLWYFGSKDIGVAHTLSRTFFWTENILWKEDLIGHRTIVFLGSKDSIINAPEVRRYLHGTEQRLNEKTVSTQALTTDDSLRVDSPLSVVWCEGLNHGEVFDISLWRYRLRSEILKEVRHVGMS